MQKFKEFLKKGDFRVPFCRVCRHTIWPPFDHCPNCKSKTTFKKTPRTGLLVEFSTAFSSGQAQDFGIINLGGVFLLGSLKGTNFFPGCRVFMYDCGVDSENRPFYKFWTYTKTRKGV